MRYFLSGAIGLVFGAIVGAVLGPITDILLQTLIYKARFSDLNLLRLRTTLFALGGAVVLGLFGLTVALIIAYLKRPKVSAPV